jgi:hypothetical protein
MVSEWIEWMSRAWSWWQWWMSVVRIFIWPTLMILVWMLSQPLDQCWWPRVFCMTLPWLHPRKRTWTLTKCAGNLGVQS